MSFVEKILEWGGIKRDITFLAISGLALIGSLCHADLLPFDIAWIAIALCGIPIVLEATYSLFTKFDIKADVLVSIALVASIYIGEYFAAGEVAFIMQLGALLEDLTVSKSRSGIEKLSSLTPQTAHLLVDGNVQTIAVEKIEAGQILRILPGETIPVDGIIISGETSIDQSVMTGESAPLDKHPGDEVLSGTTNLLGAFEMRTTKIGSDSAIQRMVRFVESADANKTKIVGLADKWATWIVAIMMVVAIATYLVSSDIIRAVTVLVVFCPCAFILATPTAVVAAIGNLTKHGILIQKAVALERLSAVERIAFDKTGTLTFGNPKVVSLDSFTTSLSKDDIWRYIASLESRSEHPLGKAIVLDYKKNYKDELYNIDGFKAMPGKGITGIICEHQVFAGNMDILNAASISHSEAALSVIQNALDKGYTLILLAIDNVLCAAIALSDTLRPDASNVIHRIQAYGRSPVLLTGDNEKAAQNIAEQLGITEYKTQCLPEDKLSYINECQTPVCMIGDGVNDAPALKAAHVGIAMGNTGSDIAVSAADIILAKDDISEIPHLLGLSKRMFNVIKFNIIFAMIFNFIAVILAMLAVIDPVLGAIVHNVGSVFVIINSAMLLVWNRNS